MARHVRRSGAAGVLLTVIAAIVVAIIPTVPQPGRAGTDVGWSSVCGYSRTASDDPIVYPGSPGLSHSHDFFGNVGTDAFSTYESLRADATNCYNSNDTAAYWVPTLYEDGTPVHPESLTAYYRPATTPIEDIQPFPPGLKIIAGDGKANEGQPLSVVAWTCGDQPPATTEPTDCGAVDVVVEILFPSCWDGLHVDVVDHKSHMAYEVEDEPSGTFSCPPGYPVPVPKLILKIRYEGVTDGTKVTLASGAGYTMHADFFNAWEPSTMTMLTALCLNAGTECGLADSEGPIMTFLAAPPPYTNSTSAVFTFEPDEPPVGPIECRLDARPLVDCSNGSFAASGLADGSHTLLITATDYFDQIGVTPYTWTVDTTPPVLTVKGGYPSGYSKVNSASFTLQSSDFGSTYHCRLDGSPWTPCMNPVTYTGLADGSHTFSAYATNRAGSDSTIASQSWVQDRTAPTIAVTGPSGLTNSRTATFTMTSNEPGSSFKCSRDGGVFVPCTSPHSWINVSDGPHTFSAYAVDPAGNSSSTSTVSWTVDATAPTVVLVSTPPDPSYATDATFVFTATDAHVVTFVCKRDGRQPAPCSSPKTYKDLTVGQHTFLLTATDTAGNSAVISYRWQIRAVLVGERHLS
jgi:hypothetical protein